MVSRLMFIPVVMLFCSLTGCAGTHANGPSPDARPTWTQQQCWIHHEGMYVVGASGIRDVRLRKRAAEDDALAKLLACHEGKIQSSATPNDAVTVTSAAVYVSGYRLLDSWVDKDTGVEYVLAVTSSARE